MAGTLRRLILTVDQVSSRMLGLDGSVGNVQSQLDEQRRSYEQIERLRRRLAPSERRRPARAA